MSELETPEKRTRRKQERRQAPDNCTVLHIAEMLEKVNEIGVEYSALINEFVGENFGKSDEVLGGKIGRVWLQVEKIYLEFTKTKELTEKRIDSDSTSGSSGDGLGEVRRQIRGLRKVINTNLKSIETLQKINPSYDVSFLEAQNSEFEIQIQKLMDENDMIEEPAPVGRKRKEYKEKEEYS